MNIKIWLTLNHNARSPLSTVPRLWFWGSSPHHSLMCCSWREQLHQGLLNAVWSVFVISTEKWKHFWELVYYLLVFNKWSGKSGLCWINDRPATLVFFCAPMLFVCVANIILYVLTVSSIDYVSSLTQVAHFACFVFRNNIIILSQTSMETGVDQIFSFTSGTHISYTIYNIKYNFDCQDLRHSWHHLGFWHHRNYGN